MKSISEPPEQIEEVFIKVWQQAGQILHEAYTNPEQHPILNIENTIEAQIHTISKIPQIGTTVENVLSEAITLIFKGYCNVLNPSYYGYISPRPLPISILGDALASGLNQTPGAWRAGPSATIIEKEVISWLAELMGYPNKPGQLPNGIITSGGTMANAMALKIARDSIMGRLVQRKGIFNVGKKPLVYMSAEGHFSIVKSLDFLGFGRDALRTIPITATGTANTEVLKKMLDEDIANNYLPLCLIGVAGTSATGSIDDLNSLAQIAKQYQLWFHVDAAAGGAYAQLPETKDLFTGLSLADSVTIDPCKWLFVAFGMGCLLVKDGRTLYDSFNAGGHYWEELAEIDTFQMGFAGTRQWRSLGLWMAFKSLGLEGYWDLLRNNLHNIHYFALRIQQEKKITLLSNPTLPVCCFKVSVPLPGLTINETNKWIQRKICEKNKHYITLLNWHGENYLRISINNYVNKPSHLDGLFSEILQLVN